MEPARYLKAFRRRWAWIVACVLVALAAGWITTATVTPPQITSPIRQQYSAEVLLLNDGTSDDPIVTNLDTLAVVATTSPVLEKVAAILDFKGNPTALAPTVVADHDTGILTVSVVRDTREQAIALADAYEQGLMAYLTDRRTGSIQGRIDRLDAKIQELQTSGGHGAELATLETQRAHLAVKVRNATAHLGLQQLAPPTATPLSSGGTTEISVSRTGRLAIVGLIGLLAGLALALLLERFDTKVRTRDTAEERFGIPVIAEIPRIPRGHRRAIVPSTTPTSPAADAFRLLGAGIGVVTPHRDDARARTVLVTSPGPADGKTTTVVNVAAALAEDGSRVLVVSADVRRPRLHEAFGAARAPGLAEAAKQDDPLLKAFVQMSGVPNVWILSSGDRTSRPGAVVGSPQVRSLLAQARVRVDWILIDTSPLLAATESALLLPEADLVLLVAMANKISSTLARRTADTLDQLQVSNVRVVLNMAKEVVMPTGYRRYYRKIEHKKERDTSVGFEAATIDRSDPAGGQDEGGEG